jgi:uncharacterized protein YjbJ (UPF0337 family)
VEAVFGKAEGEVGKLTDDDLAAINGEREQLARKLQERYDIAKEQVEKQIDEFMRSLSKSKEPVEAHKTQRFGR